MSTDRRPTLGHLARRLLGTVRARPLDDSELAWVREHLGPAEFEIWSSMDWRDQRHSVTVARRFLDVSGAATSPDQGVVAALLHDVGKASANLSTLERILVSVIGGRTERQRRYVEHEALGLEMCRRAGSDPIVLELLSGIGDPDVLDALRRADDL